MKLLEKHYQTKNSPHTNRCVTRKKILCEIKNSSIYAESGNQTKKSFSKAICKQQFFRKIIDGRYQSAVTLNQLNPFLPYYYFNKGKGFHEKFGPSRHIFQRPTSQEQQKRVSLSSE